ncbi:AraC family transcriptional regulator [Alkalispirochaeta sphaeroplastigenens]|uniref:AraC family transcriptional regulator n=2 Tax=Alkalispirochaeta sphaeroplastigenens TaxID=1187066 RepID=A0A2S4JL09_9SPIO|nr:AraC family transcriptional regulator [Alkalispirochaeta sphaeroplastigenens]
MPYMELRSITDGRAVCYAPHSHSQWSLGAITKGHSTFLCRGDQHTVTAGTLVVINPNWVHACNPIHDQPWAYLMLYIDTPWLTKLRYEAGLLTEPCWQDISTVTINDPRWYTGYRRMTECLMDAGRALLEKQSMVVEYLTALMCELADQDAEPLARAPRHFQELAAYLRDHSAEDVSLDTLCDHSGYSPGYLVRAFRLHFGLTPHAYLINCRIQRGQQELKRGRPIAEAAHSTGFSDQSHFQRTFKRLVAATPKQYRQSLLNQQIHTADGQ